MLRTGNRKKEPPSWSAAEKIVEIDIWSATYAENGDKIMLLITVILFIHPPIDIGGSPEKS
ncbi:MAG: hypothetical protein ACRCUY_04890 [Thermoguttaceae bacterium]